MTVGHQCNLEIETCPHCADLSAMWSAFDERQSQAKALILERLQVRLEDLALALLGEPDERRATKWIWKRFPGLELFVAKDVYGSRGHWASTYYPDMLAFLDADHPSWQPAPCAFGDIVDLIQAVETLRSLDALHWALDWLQGQAPQRFAQREERGTLQVESAVLAAPEQRLGQEAAP